MRVAAILAPGSGGAGRHRPPGGLRPPVRLPDPLAVGAVAVLVGLGLLNLSAIGERGLLSRQLLSVVVGGVLLLVMGRVRARALPVLGWVVYAVAVAALLAVLGAGFRAQGAQRWLGLGLVAIQPAELAKIGLLLALATVLGERPFRWRKLLLALGLTALPVALVLLEPDLSTSLLLVLIAAVVLVVARVPVRGLLSLGGVMVALGPVGLGLLRPYQLARLHAFWSGARDSGLGWSLLQSHVAIASGGFLGVAGQPLHLLQAEYLPARQTDLAYASLIEQRGLVAGAAALLATAVLVWRLVAAARVARTRPVTLVAAGLAVLIAAEALVVVAGNLGSLPLAGVPFPFVSYGGTAAVAHLAALGLVLGGRAGALERRLWAAPAWAGRRPRLGRGLAVTLALQLALVGSLTWHLQTARGSDLRQLGRAQMTRCLRLAAARGVITDRHGAVLARDAGTRVLAAPALLLPDGAAIKRLAAALGMPPARVRRRLAASPRAFTVELAEVSQATARRLADENLPGVMVDASSHREYTTGPLLAPLLGFVGVSTRGELERFGDLDPTGTVGRAGLEQRYDPILRGEDGRQCFLVDPAGTPVGPAGHLDPIAGGALRLSIDLGLQQQATADLARALGGNLGAAVVMDARSGQVLAMASLPAYDDNLYGPPLDQAALAGAEHAAGDPMLEHATQVAAPPGSTFKMVVGAADAVYEAIPPARTIPTGYAFAYGDHVYHGWGPLPPQNLTQAIAWSNDVYFYKLALALGPERIHEVGAQLGAGQPTGIDLPGEQAGLLGTPELSSQQGETWYPGTSVILGIGQGEVTATPLQVARWTAAVTGGTLVTPHLGLAYESAPGHLAPLAQPGPTALPFAARLGPVKEGLRQAAAGGTATGLGNLGPPVAAKTGSAEDPGAGGRGVDAWFAAALPAAQPQVVVTVLIRGGGEGHLVAEPVVRQILQYYIARQASILAA